MTTAYESGAEAGGAREQAKQLRAEVTGGGFDLQYAAVAAVLTGIGAAVLVFVLNFLAPLLYEYAYFFFVALLSILGAVILRNRR